MHAGFVIIRDVSEIIQIMRQLCLCYVNFQLTRYARIRQSVNTNAEGRLKVLNVRVDQATN